MIILYEFRNKMKHTYIFSVIFLICCENIENISAEDAFSILNDKQYIFLDVRTETEYNEHHIDGSILIPVQELESRIFELEKYKEDKKIIVYCRSGNRSQTGRLILSQNGFNAVNMLGGIKAWREISFHKN